MKAWGGCKTAEGGAIAAAVGLLYLSSNGERVHSSRVVQTCAAGKPRRVAVILVLSSLSNEKSVSWLLAARLVAFSTWREERHELSQVSED
jgi:hypothetical protein